MAQGVSLEPHMLSDFRQSTKLYEEEIVVKKLISLLLISMMLSMLVVGCGKSTEQTSEKVAKVPVPGVTDTAIQVGSIGDYSGPTVATQVGFTAGIRNYIQLTNENGGVNGRKIEMHFEDDQYNPSKTLSAFQKLIDNGTFAILGQAGSSNYAAIASQITEQKIPLFGPMSTDDMEINNPYTFNVALSVSDQTRLWVKYALANYKGPGKPKLAFFTLNIADTPEMEASLKAAADANGMPIVLSEKFPAATTDMSGLVTKAKQAGANYIVMYGVTGQYISVLQNLVRQGMPDVTLLAALMGTISAIPETAGEAASKNYFALHSMVPYPNPGVGMDELKQFAEKHNLKPDLLSDMQFLYGWTLGKLFVEGLKNAGKDLTRDSFMKAVEGIKNFDTGGLSGPVTFGANNRYSTMPGRFYKYDFSKKQYVPATDWMYAK
jgi:branched-chain amino acid transport system substrate-binding protein